MRSRFPALGVAPDIAERVLNHALPGMRKVYDQHDYLPQYRAALDLWGEEFERILAGEPSDSGRRKA